VTPVATPGNSKAYIVLEASGEAVTVEYSNFELLNRQCTLAHSINNKLATIVGYCDLMADKAKEDSECSKRLAEIREIALSMAKDVNGHDCRLVSSFRNGASDPAQTRMSPIQSGRL
jgi:hypothetical protein